MYERVGYIFALALEEEGASLKKEKEMTEAQVRQLISDALCEVQDLYFMDGERVLTYVMSGLLAKSKNQKLTIQFETDDKDE